MDDAIRMGCAEAKIIVAGESLPSKQMQSVWGVLRQRKRLWNWRAMP